MPLLKNGILILRRFLSRDFKDRGGKFVNDQNPSVKIKDFEELRKEYFYYVYKAKLLIALLARC